MASKKKIKEDKECQDGFEKFCSVLNSLGGSITEKMSNKANGTLNMMENLALSEEDINKKSELLDMITEEKELERKAKMQLQKKKQLVEEGKLQNTESSSDGDQTPLKGHAHKILKFQWASGMDYNPNNPRLSEWMKILYIGDYPTMVKIIEKTKKKDLKELIEKRESLLNIGSIFHVIIGAKCLCGDWKEFAEVQRSFKNGKNDHMACFHKLLELGVKLDSKDVAGYTPLHHCVTKFSNDETKKMAKILLKNGVNVNEQNRFGATPLMEPTQMGQLDVLELLVKFGGDPSIPDNDGICAWGIHKIMYPKIQEIFSKASNDFTKAKKKEATEEKGGCLWRCVGCGSADQGNKRCTGCYLVWYCGRQCQENDWKLHKKACKETKKKFVPVTIKREKIITTKNWKTGKVFVSRDTDVPSSRHFLIKVQLPEMAKMSFKNPLHVYNKDMSVYNKDRSFLGLIPPTDASYGKLEEQIKEKGILGYKGFFYAIWNGSDLSINTTDIQPPQTW